MDMTEYLENISNNFDNMTESQKYMKDRITDFSEIELFKINFTYCHIAINICGGIIAICKMKGFLDMQKGSQLNKNIVVMYQNGTLVNFIPISWDYNKKWIICLDFTPKDDLFGILSDGSIYKFNYFSKNYKEILTSAVLREQGVEKAKLFEDGFIAFTRFENIYYFKNIKDPVAILMCSKSNLINFSLNSEVVLLRTQDESDNYLQLLITSEDPKGGVIQIIQKREGQSIQMNLVNDAYIEVVGAKLILREKPQKIIISNATPEDKNDKKSKKKGKNDTPQPPPPPPDMGPMGDQPDIGKIDAIAVSPSGEKVAFYNSKIKTAYLMSANFDSKYKEVYFEYDNGDYNEVEIREINDALEYKEGCQFLFCGEDTIALSRQRFIILSKPKIKKALVYLIYDKGESEVKHGNLFSKCIQEVDGIRYLTNDGVSIITKVPKELNDIAYPFSEAPSKKLLKIYVNTLTRRYTADKDVRSLILQLTSKEKSCTYSKEVMSLLNAGANIYWVESSDDDYKKETQLFVLKAAQYAKKFIDDENYYKGAFINICKDIRVLNNLRNDEKTPIFPTYKEYKELISLTQERISYRLVKYQNFKLAALINKYYGYNLEMIYSKYISAIMKKEINILESSIIYSFKSKGKGDNTKNKYQILFDKLDSIPGISYIKLAKKARKNGGEKLALYLLEQEKSNLIKIPQFLHDKMLGEEYWEPIKLAFETYDSNALIKVFHHIIENRVLSDVLSLPNMQLNFSKVLYYLKKYRQGKYNEIFLGKEEEDFGNKIGYKKDRNIIDTTVKTKIYPEQLKISLEQFFQSQMLDKRLLLLERCKKINKIIDPNCGHDIKYYKKYIDQLEYITKFKKSCQDEDKTIIHYSVVQPYSVSVYDCFKVGYSKGKAPWLEGENKKLEFATNSKKANIIKFRGYLEGKRPEAIEAQLSKTSLKKLGLTPINMGEIYYDYKYYDKAAQYLVQVRESANTLYAIELLKDMEKYKEALEVVIADKNNENKSMMINEILQKCPKCEQFVKGLCEKYKVSL